MPILDPLRTVQKAAEIFEKAGINYLVGGSLASSLYGIPRATQDADIVADLSGRSLEKILPLLRKSFFIDEEMARDALRKRMSFNIIDRESLYKVDVFTQGDDPLADTEMKHRVRYRLADTGGHTLYLCSPEDIVAHKLYWFKLGDGVSERQWNDALNVIKVQKGRLDMDYLRMMCRARGVLRLLEKLLRTG